MIILRDGQITLVESLGLIAFYFCYVFVVIVGHVIYTRWKRQRGLLSEIQVEMEDDAHIHSLSIEEDLDYIEDSQLRPLIGGLPNNHLIPHDSYRFPLNSSRRASLMERDDDEDDEGQLIRVTDDGEYTSNTPLFTKPPYSYRGILRQMIPIIGKWNYLTKGKRFQYILLMPSIFLFGTTKISI